MPATPGSVADLQSKIWNGSLSLEIRLAASDCRTFDESDPYLIQYPRLSYLAFILPRLHKFFAPSLINPDVASHEAWLSYEEVPLKWHYPVGLLFDLFSSAEPVDSIPYERDDLQDVPGDVPGPTTAGDSIPWKLTIHYSDFPTDHLMVLDAEEKVIQDTFVNSVKEADFVRNGTARTVMSLGKDDSHNLWLAVRNHDLALFNTINTKLLNPPGLELRHIPIKVYLPTIARQAATETIKEDAIPGHLRVIQTLVPLFLSPKQPQTLGTALNSMLPTIFPSRRNPIFARPVLHGVAVPMAARMDELGRAAAYTDGFLHVAIVMHS